MPLDIGGSPIGILDEPCHRKCNWCPHIGRSAGTTIRMCGEVVSCFHWLERSAIYARAANFIVPVKRVHALYWLKIGFTACINQRWRLFFRYLGRLARQKCRVPISRLFAETSYLISVEVQLCSGQPYFVKRRYQCTSYWTVCLCKTIFNASG